MTRIIFIIIIFGGRVNITYQSKGKNFPPPKMKQRRNRDNTTVWDRRKWAKMTNLIFNLKLILINETKQLKMTNVIEVTKFFIFHFLASLQGYFFPIQRAAKQPLFYSVFPNFYFNLQMPSPQTKKSEKNSGSSQPLWLLPKKISILSVKNLIFGNAAKIGFLHKLLSRVSKLLVGTVYRTYIYTLVSHNNNNNNILHFYEAHFYISTDDQRRLLAHD